MNISSGLLRDAPGSGIADPLCLAGYVTWAAVAITPLSCLLRPEPVSPRLLIGFAGLGAVLALFVLHAVMQGRGAPLGWQRANPLAQAAAALVCVWAIRDGMQPVLLILVAAQMALLYPIRVVLAVLLVIDCAVGALLVKYGLGSQAPNPVAMAVAYAGFQAFTLLVVTYAHREADARTEARQVNRELFSTRHLLDEGVRAEERLRLSRELHDVVGHKLTALKLQLALQVRGGAPSQSAADCERLAGEVLDDIRGVVSAQRRHEGVDLHGALSALDRGPPRPKVVFALDPNVQVADMRGAHALLRCAQEALTNAFRHSTADTVKVSLAQTARGVELSVSDDGRGRAAPVVPGNGLRGIRERLEEVGGRLEICDGVPNGLVVKAVLPAASSVPC